MSSTSNTGHAKNIANFENLISFVTGYGASYNPSNTAITLPKLQTLLTDAQASLETLHTGTTKYLIAVNVRQAAFEDLKKLSTRIISALEATPIQRAFVEDAISIHRKIQGTRAGKIIKVDTVASAKTAVAAGADGGEDNQEQVPEHTNISVSQQSYDNLLEHFSKLITVLSNHSMYKPNENELTADSLGLKLTSMRNSNTAVIEKYTALSNVRIARNEMLYGETTGLCDVAAQVKSYVKSIYGSTSPNYKLVSKLSFKKQSI